MTTHRLNKMLKMGWVSSISTKTQDGSVCSRESSYYREECLVGLKIESMGVTLHAGCVSRLRNDASCRKSVLKIMKRALIGPPRAACFGGQGFNSILIEGFSLGEALQCFNDLRIPLQMDLLCIFQSQPRFFAARMC